MNRMMTAVVGLVLLFSSAVMADMERARSIDNVSPGHMGDLPDYRSPRSRGATRLRRSVIDGRTIGLLGTPRGVSRLVIDPNKSSREQEAWLGVRLQVLGARIAERFGAENGILIAEVVERSPAERAGLSAGDVIIKADENELEVPYDLAELVANRKPGEKMSLVLLCSGKKTQKGIRLSAKPEDIQSEHFM